MVAASARLTGASCRHPPLQSTDVAFGSKPVRFKTSKCLPAESLVEQVVDTRLVLAFRVDSIELKKVIPGPWEITSTAAGPAKDANFNVIFYERMLQQDGAGASMGPPYPFVVFASVVKPHEASAGTSVVSRVYASDPKRVPGPYRNSLLSTVKHRSAIDASSGGPATAEETWEVRAQPDHNISLDLKYEVSTPSRQKSEGRVYSSVDTAFYRIYRWDLLAEIPKSASTGLDHVKSYRFGATIPEYASLFSSAQLVAIISQPMYVRNVWLP
jgi:hypothetical protein